MGLLCVPCQQRKQGLCELGELVLRRRVEERHGRQIDRLRRVRCITHDHGLRGTTVPVQVDIAKQVFGVLKVRLLLRGT